MTGNVPNAATNSNPITSKIFFEKKAVSTPLNSVKTMIVNCCREIKLCMPVTLTSGKSSCNLLNITEAELPRADVKNLSKAEMLSLFETHGLAIEKCETTEMPQRLENWLALTRTPEPIQRKIKERMRSELAGGEKTGFSPYVENGTICFNQKWLLLMGRKR